MPNSSNTLPLNNFELSHPFLPNLKTSEDKARQFHRLLLDMAKDTEEKELKSTIRKTADFFRELVFGRTEAQIKAAVLEAFRDYFDGDGFAPLEINNLSELTGIDEKTLQPVVDKMVSRGELLEGRRRRYNEAGNHYNAIYKPRN